MRVYRGQVIRRFLRGHGIELIKTPHLGDFLRSRDCDLVVDVGANLGQFGRQVREFGYRGNLISFEPIAGVHAALQHTAADDPAWQVLRLALGREAGTADINISYDSSFSSIKPLASGAVEMFDIARVQSVERVPVERLDDVLRGRAEQRLFLKIDTQGYEQEVLAGAAETLEKCIGLLIELPVKQLYQGTWDFPEAIRYFDALGFEPAQIRPVSQVSSDPVCTVEFDCLFCRKDKVRAPAVQARAA
jgi:FkbM family methyltransferase